jgi:hypothetical protein
LEAVLSKNTLRPLGVKKEKNNFRVKPSVTQEWREHGGICKRNFFNFIIIIILKQSELTLLAEKKM